MNGLFYWKRLEDDYMGADGEQTRIEYALYRFIQEQKRWVLISPWVLSTQELDGHIECERELGNSKLKIMERTIVYNPDPVKEIELEL